MTATLRGPSALLGLLLLAASGCSSSNPEEYRDKLRTFLTDRCYAQGLKVRLTDKDNRAAPPTRYAAANGVAYTIRHNLTTPDGKPATLVTWVYKDAKAMEAALPSWDELKKDAQAGSEAKLAQLDSFSTPQLSAVMLLDTTNTALVNVVPVLFNEIKSGVGAALTATPK